MASRTRITPFARFFIFLIIFLPFAYFGAAYYNGEDPVAKIQNMVNGDFAQEQSSQKNTQQTNSSKAVESVYDLKGEISKLKIENDYLKKEVKRLEKELNAAKKEPKKWGDG